MALGPIAQNALVLWLIDVAADVDDDDDDDNDNGGCMPATPLNIAE